LAVKISKNFLGSGHHRPLSRPLPHWDEDRGWRLDPPVFGARYWSTDFQYSESSPGSAVSSSTVDASDIIAIFAHVVTKKEVEYKNLQLNFFGYDNACNSFFI